MFQNSSKKCYNEIMKYENIKDYGENRFSRVTGVLKGTFEAMVAELNKALPETEKNLGGRPQVLSTEDKLLLALEYYREYRTYDCIAASFGVGKGTVSRTINWVEDVLVKSGLFKLPGKRALAKRDCKIEVVVVDSTETPIDRPKNGQRRYYSGKKNGTR